MKNWMFCIFLMSVSVQSFARDSAKSLLDKTKAPELKCSKISKGCEVCADGTIKSKQSKVTLFTCLRAENKRATTISGSSACVQASKFCYACEDGSFLSTKSKKIIDSDNYECSQGPRHVVGVL